MVVVATHRCIIAIKHHTRCCHQGDVPIIGSLVAHDRHLVFVAGPFQVVVRWCSGAEEQQVGMLKDEDVDKGVQKPCGAPQSNR